MTDVRDQITEIRCQLLLTSDLWHLTSGYAPFRNFVGSRGDAPLRISKCS
jgi:hypothetical protein